jgi:hypothetical protein
MTNKFELHCCSLHWSMAINEYCSPNLFYPKTGIKCFYQNSSSWVFTGLQIKWKNNSFPQILYVVYDMFNKLSSQTIYLNSSTSARHWYFPSRSVTHFNTQNLVFIQQNGCLLWFWIIVAFSEPGSYLFM